MERVERWVERDGGAGRAGRRRRRDEVGDGLDGGGGEEGGQPAVGRDLRRKGEVGARVEEHLRLHVERHRGVVDAVVDARRHQRARHGGGRGSGGRRGGAGSRARGGSS